jgi:hypothetical protein
MTGVSGAQTCPACGSGAVSSQRRTRDPVTGKSTTPALMGVVVWGLLALAGVIMLLLLAVELIGPHPSDVTFGSLDLFIVGLCVFAIVNFWVQLRRFRGRGPGAGRVYSCRDCANEWFVADQTTASSSGTTNATPASPMAAPQPPAVRIAVPPAAPAQAPARPEAAPVDVAPGIPRIMEALKDMPLPEQVRGWNQVISVEIKDRPGLRYAWVIDGDRWHVTEGQTMRSTVRLVATEDGLMNRLATGSGVEGYSLEWPFGSSSTLTGPLKCLHLMDGMASFLRASHQPALREWQSKKYRVEAMSQEQLVSALMSADLQARKVAADALGDQGWAPPPGRDAENYWAAKLDWSRAWAAAESSAASVDGTSAQAAPSEVRRAVEYLVGQLSRKDVYTSAPVRQSLVQALVELGAPAVAEIYTHFPRVRGNRSTDLATAINLICSGPGPLEPRIKLLAYSGRAIQYLAFRPGQKSLMDALVAAGPSVIEPLIASLHDENAGVRRGAAEVLGRIGDPRAVALLGELANDPDSAVRKAAAQAQAVIRP